MTSMLLDSSVYGEIAIDDKEEEILKALSDGCKYHLCNFQLIRKELRGKKGKKYKKRNAVLPLHDTLMRGKEYRENKEIENLSYEYYQAYKSEGGNLPFKKLKIDFKIIACASIKQIDIVVSKDKNTMMSPFAKKAYEKVNILRKLKTPQLWSYKYLRKELLGF